MERHITPQQLLLLCVGTIALAAILWLAMSLVEPDKPQGRTMQFVPAADGGTVTH